MERWRTLRSSRRRSVCPTIARSCCLSTSAATSGKHVLTELNGAHSRVRRSLLPSNHRAFCFLFLLRKYSANTGQPISGLDTPISASFKIFSIFCFNNRHPGREYPFGRAK